MNVILRLQWRMMLSRSGYHRRLEQIISIIIMHNELMIVIWTTAGNVFHKKCISACSNNFAANRIDFFYVVFSFRSTSLATVDRNDIARLGNFQIGLYFMAYYSQQWLYS